MKYFLGVSFSCEALHSLEIPLGFTLLKFLFLSHDGGFGLECVSVGKHYVPLECFRALFYVEIPFLVEFTSGYYLTMDLGIK